MTTTPTQTLHDRVEHNMTNHPPSPEAIEKIEALREAVKAAAHAVVDLAPPSREQSLALTDLESALMWAVAAVAREVPK